MERSRSRGFSAETPSLSRDSSNFSLNSDYLNELLDDGINFESSQSSPVKRSTPASGAASGTAMGSPSGRFASVIASRTSPRPRSSPRQSPRSAAEPSDEIGDSEDYDSDDTVDGVPRGSFRSPTSSSVTSPAAGSGTPRAHERMHSISEEENSNQPLPVAGTVKGEPKGESRETEDDGSPPPALLPPPPPTMAQPSPGARPSVQHPMAQLTGFGEAKPREQQKEEAKGGTSRPERPRSVPSPTPFVASPVEALDAILQGGPPLPSDDEGTKEEPTMEGRDTPPTYNRRPPSTYAPGVNPNATSQPPPTVAEEATGSPRSSTPPRHKKRESGVSSDDFDLNLSFSDNEDDLFLTPKSGRSLQGSPAQVASRTSTGSFPPLQSGSDDHLALLDDSDTAPAKSSASPSAPSAPRQGADVATGSGSVSSPAKPAKPHSKGHRYASPNAAATYSEKEEEKEEEGLDSNEQQEEEEGVSSPSSLTPSPRALSTKGEVFSSDASPVQPPQPRGRETTRSVATSHRSEPSNAPSAEAESGGGGGEDAEADAASRRISKQKEKELIERLAIPKYVRSKDSDSAIQSPQDTDRSTTEKALWSQLWEGGLRSNSPPASTVSSRHFFPGKGAGRSQQPPSTSPHRRSPSERHGRHSPSHGTQSKEDEDREQWSKAEAEILAQLREKGPEIMMELLQKEQEQLRGKWHKAHQPRIQGKTSKKPEKPLEITPHHRVKAAYVKPDGVGVMQHFFERYSTPLGEEDDEAHAHSSNNSGNEAEDRSPRRVMTVEGLIQLLSDARVLDSRLPAAAAQALFVGFTPYQRDLFAAAGVKVDWDAEPMIMASPVDGSELYTLPLVWEGFPAIISAISLRKFHSATPQMAREAVMKRYLLPLYRRQAHQGEGSEEGTESLEEEEEEEEGGGGDYGPVLDEAPEFYERAMNAYSEVQRSHISSEPLEEGQHSTNRSRASTRASSPTSRYSGSEKERLWRPSLRQTKDEAGNVAVAPAKHVKEAYETLGVTTNGSSASPRRRSPTSAQPSPTSPHLLKPIGRMKSPPVEETKPSKKMTPGQWKEFLQRQEAAKVLSALRLMLVEQEMWEESKGWSPVGMAAGSRRIARQKGLDQATQEDAMRRLYGVAQDDHSEVQSEEELRQILPVKRDLVVPESIAIATSEALYQNATNRKDKKQELVDKAEKERAEAASRKHINKSSTKVLLRSIARDVLSVLLVLRWRSTSEASVTEGSKEEGKRESTSGFLSHRSSAVPPSGPAASYEGEGKSSEEEVGDEEQEDVVGVLRTSVGAWGHVCLTKDEVWKMLYTLRLLKTPPQPLYGTPSYADTAGPQHSVAGMLSSPSLSLSAYAATLAVGTAQTGAAGEQSTAAASNDGGLSGKEEGDVPAMDGREVDLGLLELVWATLCPMPPSGPGAATSVPEVVTASRLVSLLQAVLVGAVDVSPDLLVEASSLVVQSIDKLRQSPTSPALQSTLTLVPPMDQGAWTGGILADGAVVGVRPLSGAAAAPTAASLMFLSQPSLTAPGSAADDTETPSKPLPVNAPPVEPLGYRSLFADIPMTPSHLLPTPSHGEGSRDLAGPGGSTEAGAAQFQFPSGSLTQPSSMPTLLSPSRMDASMQRGWDGSSETWWKRAEAMGRSALKRTTDLFARIPEGEEACLGIWPTKTLSQLKDLYYNRVASKQQDANRVLPKAIALLRELKAKHGGAGKGSGGSQGAEANPPQRKRSDSAEHRPKLCKRSRQLDRMAMEKEKQEYLAAKHREYAVERSKMSPTRGRPNAFRFDAEAAVKREDLLLEKGRKRLLRLHSLRHAQELKDAENLRFRPDMTATEAKTREILSQREAPEDVANRAEELYRMHEDRQRRLALRRKTEEEEKKRKELEQCTFQPNTKPSTATYAKARKGDATAQSMLEGSSAFQQAPSSSNLFNTVSGAAWSSTVSDEWDWNIEAESSTHGPSAMDSLGPLALPKEQSERPSGSLAKRQAKSVEKAVKRLEQARKMAAEKRAILEHIEKGGVAPTALKRDQKGRTKQVPFRITEAKHKGSSYGDGASSRRSSQSSWSSAEPPQEAVQGGRPRRINRQPQPRKPLQSNYSQRHLHRPHRGTAATNAAADGSTHRPGYARPKEAAPPPPPPASHRASVSSGAPEKLSRGYGPSTSAASPPPPPPGPGRRTTPTMHSSNAPVQPLEAAKPSPPGAALGGTPKSKAVAPSSSFKSPAGADEPPPLSVSQRHHRLSLSARSPPLPSKPAGASPPASSPQPRTAASSDEPPPLSTETMYTKEPSATSTTTLVPPSYEATPPKPIDSATADYSKPTPSASIATAPSTPGSESRAADRGPVILIVEVALSRDATERISIHMNDNPADLAQQFAEQYKLTSKLQARLEKKLMSQKAARIEQLSQKGT